MIGNLLEAVAAYAEHSRSNDNSLLAPQRSHQLSCEMLDLADRVAKMAVRIEDPYMLEQAIRAKVVYEYYTGRGFVCKDANPLYDAAIYELSKGRPISEADAEFIRKIEAKGQHLTSELVQRGLRTASLARLQRAQGVAKYAASLIEGPGIKPGAHDATLQQRIVKALVRDGVGQAAYDHAMAQWHNDCQEAEDRGELLDADEGEREARIFAALEIEKVRACFGEYEYEWPGTTELAKKHW